jgi:hypothetical protein
LDEVWINDDRSTDKTKEVIEWALATYKNVNTQNLRTQAGWVKSASVLFTLTDARYIFRIDADDMLYPNATNEIEKIVNDESGCFLLGLQECWGDFHHSRRGLEMNWDPVHLFVDRKKCDVTWSQGPPPRSLVVATTSVEKKRWPKPLFFHAPGVKSDERCVLRTMMSEWVTAGRPCPIEEWPRYRALSTQEIHEKALRYLLYAGNSRTKLAPIPTALIPKVCLANERFELIKDRQGSYTDRVDHGWIFDPSWS